MAVRVYLEKDKKKRAIGIAELAIGVICLVISIGLFSASDKYGLPLFAMLASVYMILNARINLIFD